MPQPGNPEQCRNEDGFRPDTSGFGAQMGSESRSVRGLTGENVGAVLVSMLLLRRVHCGNQKGLGYLERIRKILGHVVRYDAGRQSGTEGLMPLTGVPVAETPNEV